MLSIDEVLARTIVRLREGRGWSQIEMAQEVRRTGMLMTPSRIAQIETHKGFMSPAEIIAMCAVFGIGFSQLLEGDEGEAVMFGRLAQPLDALRDGVGGRWRPLPTIPMAARWAEVEDVRKIAPKLGLAPNVTAELVRVHYGRTYREERDARVGDPAELSTASLGMKRSHAGRKIIKELTAWMAQEQMPEALDPVIESLAGRMRTEGQELYERAEKLMENPEANVDQLHAIYAEDYRDLLAEILATRGFGITPRATHVLVEAHDELNSARMVLRGGIDSEETRRAIWSWPRDGGHRTEPGWFRRSGHAK